MSSSNDPRDGIEDALERLGRHLERVARTSESALEERGHLDLSASGAATRLDLADRGDEFVVTVDVPGYEPDDLDIRLERETLRIVGERDRDVATQTNDPEDSGATYLRRERETQSFSRSVGIPAPVDADEVTATLTNGVLTVRLPTVESTDGAHSIDID
ncbi:Hsp20/alpha crystallin family protein [Natronolimnohabitans innermongolicus]|uniref:Heat shock protein Hsp20 n=1 Tax=Natronolimnohabitans innermongolicus JCM 12255 TaxID=1227499 RepID=L9X6M2_9EURY|nr:Hsp20/alpha crystallin family protein [Natronolimnohabitans innermongolicus]ELY57439.1 heat shock protein Hsp20 [Natronolimnohabitans innermongolicus JCM 12255]